MLRIHRSSLALLSLLGIGTLAIAGCGADESAASVSAPSAPETGATAFISLSNLAPAAGQVVTVSVSAVHAVGNQSIGSFMFKLSYDTTALQFVEAVRDTAGMVMANVAGGKLHIAGASGGGFKGNQLAQVRMRVRHPAALSSLTLEVTELTAVDFIAHAKNTRIDSRHYRGTPE